MQRNPPSKILNKHVVCCTNISRHEEDSSMVTTPRQDLERELQDPEYAKLYGAAQAKAEFAVTLSNARISAGMTQKELAEKLGRSQPYIAKLERGDANPTIGTIGSLLAILDCRLVTRTHPLSPSPTENRAKVGCIYSKNSFVPRGATIPNRKQSESRAGVGKQNPHYNRT